MPRQFRPIGTYGQIRVKQRRNGSGAQQPATEVADLRSAEKATQEEVAAQTPERYSPEIHLHFTDSHNGVAGATSVRERG